MIFRVVPAAAAVFLVHQEKGCLEGPDAAFHPPRFIAEKLEDGNTYLVQYFERARFEYHPEHKGTPYEVQLGQFGRRVLGETVR